MKNIVTSGVIVLAVALLAPEITQAVNDLPAQPGPATNFMAIGMSG
jgi:hypothetical protein